MDKKGSLAAASYSISGFSKRLEVSPGGSAADSRLHDDIPASSLLGEENKKASVLGGGTKAAVAKHLKEILTRMPDGSQEGTAFISLDMCLLPCEGGRAGRTLWHRSRC